MDGVGTVPWAFGMPGAFGEGEGEQDREELSESIAEAALEEDREPIGPSLHTSVCTERFVRLGVVATPILSWSITCADKNKRKRKENGGAFLVLTLEEVMMGREGVKKV